MAYPQLQLCIAGDWRSRPGQPIPNPFDDSVLGELPHATRADLDEALDAADAGHRAWRRTAPAKRAAIMQQAARLLRERADTIAEAITLEQGKPRAQARAGSPRRGQSARVAKGVLIRPMKVNDAST